MPGGHVPALEPTDGTLIGESTALLRFLGRKHGYYPSDPALAYRADALTDDYADVFPKIAEAHLAPDEATRGPLLPALFGQTLPAFLDQVEPLCAKGQFLTGDSLCTADFLVGGLYTDRFTNSGVAFGEELWPKLLEKYPNFKAYGERFAAANERYLSTRPDCPG